MTLENQLSNEQKGQVSIMKPVLIGAGIALLVISFFVFGVDDPKPEWGQYWIIRPLIITPLAGAAGGAFYAFMEYQSSRDFNRTAAVILDILVYVITLWLGVVLGLDGTMWD
ncbi:potassium transporter KefB [Antarcticibacterium flavum]|uniref:Potassium transporter KefB n=1 Tax=Antarcticibacterium flavum TaxID=2058175 RepID=A0A5B7WYU8_9FLAO|nr:MULTISPECIES: potassium transporter KefB [Antarcticibacterium]MCM4158891.1 potassium transporter KefB [Antarcticibacterium sp. W02-3]QCY68145.1 potassium transporter KefB [Antarcticibacterium flavum]